MKSFIALVLNGNDTNIDTLVLDAVTGLFPDEVIIATEKTATVQTQVESYPCITPIACVKSNTGKNKLVELNALLSSFGADDEILIVRSTQSTQSLLSLSRLEMSMPEWGVSALNDDRHGICAFIGRNSTLKELLEDSTDLKLVCALQALKERADTLKKTLATVKAL